MTWISYLATFKFEKHTRNNLFQCRFDSKIRYGASIKIKRILESRH
jgi:hypothetical protein